MKKNLFLMAFLLCCLAVFAQEKKIAVGIAPEWNMNSRYYFAGGVGLNIDHRLPINGAIGLNITASTNFAAIKTLEAAATFRVYSPEQIYSGAFADIDLGLFFFFENQTITPYPLVGFKGGYRKLLGSSFYIEPYGRIGYPFAFGFGIMAGLCF